MAGWLGSERGNSSGQHITAYDTRVLKIRGPANLAGAWSAQPVPASRRPPHAAHRPAAARAPRTTPGCTCGHGSAPPTAPRPRAYAGGGPWRRKSPFGSPMTGRRPRMTRAHDRQRTLPQRRCTSCMKTPSASCSLRAPIRVRGGTSSGRHARPTRDNYGPVLPQRTAGWVPRGTLVCIYTVRAIGKAVPPCASRMDGWCRTVQIGAWSLAADTERADPAPWLHRQRSRTDVGLSSTTSPKSARRGRRMVTLLLAIFSLLRALGAVPTDPLDVMLRGRTLKHY